MTAFFIGDPFILHVIQESRDRTPEMFSHEGEDRQREEVGTAGTKGGKVASKKPTADMTPLSVDPSDDAGDGGGISGLGEPE